MSEPIMPSVLLAAALQQFTGLLADDTGVPKATAIQPASRAAVIAQNAPGPVLLIQSEPVC